METVDEWDPIGENVQWTKANFEDKFTRRYKEMLSEEKSTVLPYCFVLQKVEMQMHSLSSRTSQKRSSECRVCA